MNSICRFLVLHPDVSDPEGQTSRSRTSFNCRNARSRSTFLQPPNARTTSTTCPPFANPPSIGCSYPFLILAQRKNMSKTHQTSKNTSNHEVVPEIFNLDMDSSEDEPSPHSSIYEAPAIALKESLQLQQKVDKKKTNKVPKKCVEQREAEVSEKVALSPFSAFLQGIVRNAERGKPFIRQRTPSPPRTKIIAISPETVLESPPSFGQNSLGAILHERVPAKVAPILQDSISPTNYSSSDDLYSDSSDYSSDSTDDDDEDEGGEEEEEEEEYARPKQPHAPPPRFPESGTPQSPRNESLFRRLEPMQYFRPVSTSPMTALFRSQQGSSSEASTSPPPFRAPRSQNRAYGALANHPFHHAPIATSNNDGIVGSAGTRHSTTSSGYESTPLIDPYTHTNTRVEDRERLQSRHRMYAQDVSGDQESSDEESLWAEMCGIFCCLDTRERMYDTSRGGHPQEWGHF